MSRFRRFEIIEPSSPSLFLTETSIFTPKTLTLNPFFPSFAVEHDELDFNLDLLAPTHCPSLLDFTSPFNGFDAVTDLIQIETTPFYISTRKVQQRVRTESYLQSLSDRVSALEISYDRLSKAKPHGGDRKYTWTAEIESPEKHGFDRKYKWTAEIKGGGKKKKKKKSSNEAEPKVEKNYKWTAEIKGKGDNAPIHRTYTFKSSNGNAGESTKSEKKDRKKKGEKVSGTTRLVEIEEPTDHEALVLRQAFAKRVEKCRGKRKEVSPQDAATMIQMSFRAYLIRRSQALRGLRELAVAKAKLKEIRALFNNFSYRRCIARDAEECQKFTERIIVLLLTVDAIEGADVMVRASKRSMVDELEAMLDVVDPQPPGKSLSMRRTFDMPDAVVQKELAEGVAQLVEMLDEEQRGAKHL